MQQRRFQQTVRNISSPPSQSGSFTQSTVINKSTNYQQFSQQPIGSQSNLKYSQASYATSSNNKSPQQFYTSQVTQQQQPSISSSRNLFTSNVSDTSVRGFYRGLGSLPQDRMRQIAQSFIKVYGSGGEIRKLQLQKIQQIAHSNDTTRFEQSQQTVGELFTVMDQNTRDKRINEEDIMMLCRRYLNCEKKPIVYTPMVQQRLSVARRLFKQFDVQKKGYLTQKQVPNLLSETYKSLGREFKATQEDIRSWKMKLADGDGDGHVTLVQYERSIIRALKKQGIKIYED